MLPLKLARPHAFDGTALCVGAMAPDLAYPLTGWLAHQSHTATGIVVWCIPATLVICVAIRTWVAPTAFAHFPDIPFLRIHSYCVLARRWPPLWQTIVGAAIGATTHVLIDGFTHDRRWGAQWLDLDQGSVPFPLRGDLTYARAMQYYGHTLGSALAVMLLIYIARKRLFEQWYGEANVRWARDFTLRPFQRVLFWSVVASGVLLAYLWAEATTYVKAFRLIDALAFTTAIACALPWCRPRRPLAFDRAQLPDRRSTAPH